MTAMITIVTLLFLVACKLEFFI